MSDHKYQGSCMCGSVRYGFDESLPDFGLCHCDTCQKASGSAFTANIPMDRSSVTFEGDENIKEFESSPGKLRCFCAECGSPLYAYLSKTPNLLRIRIGTLDSDVDKSPSCHFFTGDKAAWFEASKDVPEFERWPSKDVLVLRGSRHGDS